MIINILNKIKIKRIKMNRRKFLTAVVGRSISDEEMNMIIRELHYLGAEQIRKFKHVVDFKFDYNEWMKWYK